MGLLSFRGSDEAFPAKALTNTFQKHVDKAYKAKLGVAEIRGVHAGVLVSKGSA